MKTFVAKPIAVVATLTLLGIAARASAQEGPVIPPDDGSKSPSSARGNAYQTPYYAQPATPTGFGASVRPDSWPSGSPSPSTPNAAGPAPASQGGNPYGIPSGQIGPGSMTPGATFIPSQVPPNPSTSGPPPSPVIPCEMVLARVDTEVILSSDVRAGEAEFFSRFKGKIPAEQFDAQCAHYHEEATAGIAQLAEHWNAPDPGSFVDSGRRMLLYQMASQIVEYKMLYLNFLRTVPKEALPNIEETVGRHFDDSELAILLKREKAVSREELETKLRAKGSSLEREKLAYTQRLIAQQWIREKVNPDKEITHEQMLEYYEKHKAADYTTPARVHWEELAVQSGKFPSKEAAYAALADMGNQVLFGANFADVAKTRSQGFTADKGGERGWNTKGGLADKSTDETLFGTLAVGQLSPILETSTGYQIIRVSERQELATTPFSKVQSEIKEKIKKERLDKSYAEFMTKVRKQYPVWTVFDAANKRAAAAAAAAGGAGGMADEAQ